MARRIAVSLLIMVALRISMVVELVEATFSHYDRIVRLPGQSSQVDFRQFSGYVNVDDKMHRDLFYYFVKEETYPASKALVLWLNGGLGCSSLGLGAFLENESFRPSGKVLVRNECS